MYLIPLKTLFVIALRETFDSNYPEADFQNTKVGIEYPVDPQAYPSIWVDFQDDQPLIQAGVAQVELVTAAGGGLAARTRFRFGGDITFTIVALSSLERDRLFDEMIKTLAFGKENTFTSRFRTMIETNDYIAVNAKFDSIPVGGNNAGPGTPWGTDEIIYERTISLGILGEFVIDPATGGMVVLSSILTHESLDLMTSPDAPVGFPADDGKGAWI